MNSNAPVPASSGNAATAATPTLASLLGAAGGLYLSSLLKIADPLTQGTLVTLVTGAVTGLGHWLAVKLTK